MSDLGSERHHRMTRVMGKAVSRDGYAVPAPQGPPGRLCAHFNCTTILSRYNRGDYCWAHSIAHPRFPELNREPRELEWANHGTDPMRRRGCRCNECREAM